MAKVTHETDSPVADEAAREAIDEISRMRSTDKLNEIVATDSRSTVVEAARKRLVEVEGESKPTPPTGPVLTAEPDTGPVRQFKIISGSHYDDEGEHTPDNNPIVKSRRDLAAKEPSRYIAI
jgi:hypothetical protein